LNRPRRDRPRRSIPSRRRRELDRLDRLLAVEDDRFLVVGDLPATERPQERVPEARRVAEGVPAVWHERVPRLQFLPAARYSSQVAGHTFGDAPSFWYPFLWSFGGRRSPTTRKRSSSTARRRSSRSSSRFAFWKECCDEGGLAWDDSSNNRAFLSGTISSTNNGASIYIESKRKPDSYQTDKGAPLKTDIFHTRLPKGPAGEFIYPTPFTHMVMGYSKNQKAAKDLLGWAGSKAVYGQWFTSQQGFCTGATKDWEKDPVWEVDPIMLPFKTVARFRNATLDMRPVGARRGRGGYQVHHHRHVTRRAIQGMAAEDAANGRTPNWLRSTLNPRGGRKGERHGNSRLP